MPRQVTDVRSSPADQIAHAVDVLGRATQRIAVFKAIYTGKKAAKTVNEIATATGLDRIRVLQEGKRLADNQIVRQIGVAGSTAYQKDRFYAAQKSKILQLVRDPAAYANFPTKAKPKPSLPAVIKIEIPRAVVRVKLITVDDLDSFSRLARLRSEPESLPAIEEARFKRGIASILNEEGRFQDWGGEKNDLFTTKLRLLGHRHAAAFAFKGPGTKGTLVPGKLGKNGDQIQRLFASPATVFFVQYHGQIAQSVVEQMEEFAKVRSVAVGETIYYGVIDGNDSSRVMKAYHKYF